MKILYTVCAMLMLCVLAVSLAGCVNVQGPKEIKVKTDSDEAAGYMKHAEKYMSDSE
jgi:starvation-inducible outer membrane lipoprotein